jgi:hypothetical protein
MISDRRGTAGDEGGAFQHLRHIAFCCVRFEGVTHFQRHVLQAGPGPSFPCAGVGKRTIHQTLDTGAAAFQYGDAFQVAEC